jgi:serine/threonine protein kinase
MIENYSILEQLGEGVYAKVFKAVNVKNKQEVAIKVIPAEKFKQIPKL